MQIYLIRHGKDLSPIPGRLSNLDVGLSDVGKAQALQCAKNIAHEFDGATKPRIFTSPKLRTTQAAEIVASYFGVNPKSIRVDDRLQERDCSAYAGELIADVFSRTESELIAGGMEPYEDLVQRLNLFLNSLSQEEDSSPIIIVSHSGNVEPLLKLTATNPSVSTQKTLKMEEFARLK